MEDLSRTLIALSELISANSKRANTYESAVEKTENQELKSVFSQYLKQARHFNNNLSNWRSAYGGFAFVDKKQSGPGWSLLSILGRSKNMIGQCDQAEHDALKVYRSVLGLAVIPPEAFTDIQRQAREIEKAIEHLRTLKNQPEPAQR